MIKYCRNCLLPNTKPYIKFNIDNICSACDLHFSKKFKKKISVNWKKRNKEFLKVINKIKSLKSPFYDVCVPVSGGKDSISQIHYLLNKGLRILAVNIDYGIKTEIGNYNLNLIPLMGVNLITYRPNLKLQKKVIKIGFEKYGDPDLMSHCLLHAYPIRVAIQYKIPLVLHGENSAYEYSGDINFKERNFDSKWFEKYAANKGMTPKKFAKKHKINFRDMSVYDLPNKNDLKKTKVYFTSYFFKWSGEINLKIAKKYGFKTLKKPREGTYRNYVGIDEKINRIHQFLKLLKFGYGRATDHACEDIRNKKISREQGIKLVLKHDRKKLSNYFINDFIKFISISSKSFHSTLKKFTNKKIWNKKNKKALKNFNFI